MQTLKKLQEKLKCGELEIIKKCDINDYIYELQEEIQDLYNTRDGADGEPADYYVHLKEKNGSLEIKLTGKRENLENMGLNNDRSNNLQK